MSEALIIAAARTPIGKFRGALASLPATELGAIAVRAAVERARVDPARVDEIVLGNVLSAGLGQAPARQAALKAGLPPMVPALTINKVCGSGLKAVMLAAQAIRAGEAEVVVAGGMESMSRAPWLLARDVPPLGERRLDDSMLHDGLVCALSGRSMGDIAEGLAESDGISRLDQDQFALESHRRAVSALSAGKFEGEIVPIPVRQGKETIMLALDEGPRSESTLAALAGLRPAFRPQGTVTAGNASMISDGAAAVVVASRPAAEKSGVRPLARIVASATSGGPPEELFTAPVLAIQQVLARAGLSAEEIDLFEINEAFAVQMLACVRRLNLPLERVNVHGGAIALGHPIGASGARVLVTLLGALQTRGGRYGVAALCLGGGNAVAMVVERLD
jgi:acetyl-CoA C-acetyltransferase